MPLDVFHHETRLPYLRVTQHADFDHDAATKARGSVDACHTRPMPIHAHLFCSVPFSPPSLELLGPAFAVGVGEDDEAEADMCQERA